MQFTNGTDRLRRFPFVPMVRIVRLLWRMVIFLPMVPLVRVSWRLVSVCVYWTCVLFVFQGFNLKGQVFKYIMLFLGFCYNIVNTTRYRKPKELQSLWIPGDTATNGSKKFGRILYRGGHINGVWSNFMTCLLQLKSWKSHRARRKPKEKKFGGWVKDFGICSLDFTQDDLIALLFNLADVTLCQVYFFC